MLGKVGCGGCVARGEWRSLWTGRDEGLFAAIARESLEKEQRRGIARGGECVRRAHGRPVGRVRGGGFRAGSAQEGMVSGRRAPT